MTRKVTHEIKLPKSLTAAIYVIAITNIFSSHRFIGVAPAPKEKGVAFMASP